MIKQNIGKTKSVISWINKQWKVILAEFLATMLLIIFGCMACVPIQGFTPHPPMYAPLTFGLTVMFNIQIFGHISGAYMNPCVTVIALMWGKISVVTTIAIILAEAAGAVCGYGILMSVAPTDIAANGVCMTLPHPGINDIQATGIEIILTAALSLITCAVWDPVNADKADSVPIKFGLTIAGLSFSGGPITGASMNPVRSLGPALWANDWTSHWVYWVGPFVGAILPALFYKYIWLQKNESKTMA